MEDILTVFWKHKMDLGFLVTVAIVYIITKTVIYFRRKRRGEQLHYWRFLFQRDTFDK
jgi:hypothetical protein